MRWTTDRPMVEGFYWARIKTPFGGYCDNYVNTIVKVIYDDERGLLVRAGATVPIETFSAVAWAGPIEEPGGDSE
jgi:hypothetical protein